MEPKHTSNADLIVASEVEQVVDPFAVTLYQAVIEYLVIAEVEPLVHERLLPLPVALCYE